MAEFATGSDPAGDRFEIRRRLGSGGMGVVYEAFDRRRNEVVAIKKLIETDAAAIYRLKQEFRSLADVAHPNLVALYELVNRGEDWFFTMELVRGMTFLTYVRPSTGWTLDSAHPSGQTERDFEKDGELMPTERQTPMATPLSDPLPPMLPQQRDSTPPPVTPDSHTPPPVVAQCVARIDVLRPALRQLCEGVAALHRAGKLHRDLKPPNVLITPQGRVVVLDFGLATDVQPDKKMTFAGTPAYMSPEQIAERPATEASDWYSIGVMLYEALTGQLPFPGNAYSMMLAKQSMDAPPPSSIVSGIPADLNRLCVDLLRRLPEHRPLGPEILRRLNTQSGEAPVTKTQTRRLDAPFVGRSAELQMLQDAMATARNGQAVTVLIQGRSGMGKSTLVRRFIEEARADDRSVVVLSGRCYEQESLPYKALDNLIDDLTQYLRSLSSLEAKAVLPIDVMALARLFPVLEGIEAVKKGRRKIVDVVDSQQLRRRAFAALREMMSRIVDERPVVLFLDDLQWGDRDSAAVIGELLRPPDAPALLLVATYRREEAESPFLAELRKQRDDRTLADVREIALDELQADDARDLARALLGKGATSDRVEAVAREAAGSPFFIHEIGRFSDESGETMAAPEADDVAGGLDDLIRARVARLNKTAQDLLEVVAIAGQPLEASVARMAARIEAGDVQPLVSTLRGAHLVRTRVRGGREEIVAYHDRIREAILHRIAPPRRRAWHLRLANTLEELGWNDPEVLAIHFQGAGDQERAAGYALQAAEKAAASLAFDHAARLYKLALELQGMEHASAPRLIQLADTLSNAGRAAEAAEYYLRAADMVEAKDALEMRRRAMEGLLRSGHVDDGFRVLRDVLASVGMNLPTSRRQLIAGILFHKLLAKFRGFGFRERELSEIPADLLLRVDVCWAVTTGLSRIDNVLAVYFQPMHLRLALKAGDPYRVARALSVEAGFTSLRGAGAAKKTEDLLARTERLARRLGDPHAMGMALMSGAVAAFSSGRFRAAAEKAEQADAVFRERCTGVWWEMNTTQNYAVSSLAYLGEMEQLSRRVLSQLRDAEERGDLYAATDMVGRPAIVWLALDDPEGARRALRSIMARWSLQGFHFQHLQSLWTESLVDLYNGNAAEAWRRIEERWPALLESLLLRIQVVRIESWFLHGRVAIAAGHPAVGARDAERLRKENIAWALPLAQLLEAGASSANCHDVLASAAANFDKVEMHLHAAATRRRLGELTNNAAMVAAADEWMDAQRVKNPARLTNVLVPSCR
ncbi:MAG TPA: protein kinase [Thermoanaerobaculia bacterium]|jgi:serine/threonine protein kinase/tetratricopeptide (TPR) repeat protein|nr:protein kinase [Thermoanaerobaculia bacterium]